MYNSYTNQNNSGQSLPSFNASQQQQPVLGPQAAVDPSDTLHASQPHFDHGPSQGAPMFPGSTAGAGSYSVQGLHNVYGHHQVTHEPNFRQVSLLIDFIIYSNDYTLIDLFVIGGCVICCSFG